VPARVTRGDAFGLLAGRTLTTAITGAGAPSK
jgi:hypothetical protein